MIVLLLLTVTFARNFDTKTISEAVENFLPDWMLDFDPAMIKMAKNDIGKISIK